MAEAPDREGRTEEPTQRRLDQAVERGDVARSLETSTFMALGALALALALSAGWSAKHLALGLRFFLASPHLVPDDPAGLAGAGRQALVVACEALAAPVGLLAAAALAAGLAQHRPLWSAEPMRPQLSRLSPMAGLARVFGKQAVGQFSKGLLKIVAVGALASATLWGERDRLEAMTGLWPGDLMAIVLSLSERLLGAILALHAVFAAADYGYSRFAWLRRQRMTRQEIKEEQRDADGNPEIKAKLRQIRARRVRKRMMAAVPKATVVITNPTHYAVALRYEKGQAAPICVAKGIDELAARIRAVAEEHRVPLVENPPLARALHATVDVEDEIPVEHYRAVAEVIGFVLRVNRRAS